jgi:glycosyltransferase involved in cell wall biosynthesis
MIMKILLAGEYEVIHTRRYLDLILKAGFDVVLLNTSRRGILVSEIPVEHWHLPRSGRTVTRYLVGRTLADKLGDALVRWQLRWLRTKIRPDITHVQWVGEVAWLIAKAGFSPLVLTSWGTDLNLTRDRGHDPNLLRRKAEVIANAALLIADSEDMIKIANDLVMSSVPSMLLSIGIDTGLFKPGRKAEALKRRLELDIPEAAKVVLSPRAFREDYGHDTIVRAFARAIRNEKIDAYLVFKAYDCRDRTYIDKITNIALEYEISDRVRVIEEMPYEHLPIYYAMGDFAVNFPVRDAFPVTFMESLACELPVLTKHLPAYDSLGIAPYLRFTDAPCESALETGISKMLSSVHSCLPNMSRARAYVCAHFDESVVAKSLADAYYRVLNAGEKIS